MAEKGCLKDGIVKISAVALYLLILTIMLISCGGQVQLPDYVHRVSGGAVQVDVGEASNGSAYFSEHGRIYYDWDNYKTEFILWAASAKGGLSTSQLPDPPLKISPLITPNDGVADFFTAVRIDDETQDLHITLFIDTDWQELVEGQIVIHTLQYNKDGERLEAVEPVDFSKAVDGVYAHELEFALEDNSGYLLSPIVAVTNMLGEPKDVLLKAQRVEVSGNDVYLGIIPRLVQP